MTPIPSPECAKVTVGARELREFHYFWILVCNKLASKFKLTMSLLRYTLYVLFTQVIVYLQQQRLHYGHPGCLFRKRDVQPLHQPPPVTVLQCMIVTCVTSRLL